MASTMIAPSNMKSVSLLTFNVSIRPPPFGERTSHSIPLIYNAAGLRRAARALFRFRCAEHLPCFEAMRDARSADPAQLTNGIKFSM
jgi:hypothetical protein